MTINIKNESFVKINQFISSNYDNESFNKNISINVTKTYLSFDIIKSFLLEKYTITKVSLRDRLNEDMKQLSLVKDVLSSAVFISIMQLLLYAGMMCFGIPAPIFVDYFVVKTILFTGISFFGYYFNEALFPQKKDFFQGFAVTVFFSSLYQINNFLLF